METKVLQVFYGKDCLPYKDKERSVHFPIIGAAIQGASNTTKIRFYFDQLVEEDDETTSWVVVSKLPNGKIGSEIVETELDEELNEHYALFSLKNFYTQAKGDLFLSLQGYQGGVQVETDPDTGISQIVGTPTIQATGSIKLAINYATQLVGSGETANINFQKILADLGTKLNMRTETELVDELPTTGETNVFYVVYDEPNEPQKANIYVWNGTTKSYVWVGDNSLYLGNYYTKEQANSFEESITNRINDIENLIQNTANGSPRGVYSTLSDLQNDNPDHQYIYLVGTDWYYWNGTTWTNGGTYLSGLPDYALDESSANSIENSIVAKSFNNIVKSFQNINSYLYKKDTYINASNEETYIDGCDLYKIPVKDFEVILLTWDANDPFYDSGFNVAYLFDIEDANGDITSLAGSYGYSTHGFYPADGVAIFFADNLLGAKYLYVCVQRLKASTLNLKIENTNQVITNDYETNKIKVVEYNNNDNFINTPAFINSSNLSSILAGGSYAAYIKMKQGDKLIFEGNLVDISYNGAYRDISGSTITSLGTAREFVATSEIIAFVFLQPGGTRKITYIPKYIETLVKNTTERALKENSLYTRAPSEILWFYPLLWRCKA